MDDPGTRRNRDPGIRRNRDPVPGETGTRVSGETGTRVSGGRLAAFRRGRSGKRRINNRFLRAEWPAHLGRRCAGFCCIVIYFTESVYYRICL